MTQAESSIPDSWSAESGARAGVLLSHDIRAALTRILSTTHLLEAAPLDGENADHVARIKEAALYINDLLAEAGEKPDKTLVMELTPALTQLENTWADEASQKGISFSLESKGSMPGALRFAKLDFFRIFNNIIGNALKVSTKGALIVRLTRDSSGGLSIEVLDEGPGFTAAEHSNLFSLHGRTEGGGQSGSGFGLYIVRSLLRKAGGGLTIENRPSGGARVAVVFPEDLLIAAAKPERAPRPKTGLPDLSHLNILLAEDNPTNQLVATQMLKKMNARVKTASDGVEAIDKFENENFNLGLIDIEMPRKSGLEVMRDIRAREDQKAGMTLLALTAYVLPEHQDRIKAAGADGIIAKPLTDIAAFGNAILVHTGEAEPSVPAAVEVNPDAHIDMDIYNGLKEIIGHDSMQELLTKVMSDLGDVRAGVLEGAAAQNEVPIRANTHILISVAGAIGAVNLQHIAEKLNATAKSGDWPRIHAQSARCEAGVSEVLGFIADELDN